jgi:hypothetical protein
MWNEQSRLGIVARRPGQHHADVQFAKLLGRDFRRRAHQQILGALVHREQHDLAQILLASWQHDDAVAGRRKGSKNRAVSAGVRLGRFAWSTERADANL